MQSPKLLTNAWFEQIFDTMAWDIAARIIFVVSFGWIVQSSFYGLLGAWQARTPDEWSWVEMATRTLAILNNSIPILIVIVRRRPVARMHGFGAKIVALAGTFLPLGFLFLPYGQPATATTLISGAFLILGGTLMVWTWPHLGRSYSIMAEARKLKTSGPYRFVRHPLYLFEELNVIGIFLLYASPAATLLLIAQIGCQLVRIHNEERVLSGAFAEYREYQQTTSKLIPGIY
jgi:protein-S-isoprenylcysteine O-methyltransferase Ste14